MDPTAPNNNNDQNNPQDGDKQHNNPIQTGQYVVSGEPGVQPSQSVPTPPPTNVQPPPQSQNNPPMPDPNLPPTGDLEKNLQQNIAQATGSNPSSSIEQPPNNPSINEPPKQPDSMPAQPAPQPDPTPFSPPPDAAPQPGPMPGAPNLGSQPPPQQQDSDSGSKMGKMIPIIVGIVALIAIVAAVAWFFILNRQSEESTTTSDQTEPIQLPPSPSPKSENGFGEIVESPSPEASPPSPTESPDLTIPPTEVISPGLTTQQ